MHKFTGARFIVLILHNLHNKYCAFGFAQLRTFFVKSVAVLLKTSMDSFNLQVKKQLGELKSCLDLPQVFQKYTW